jgi:acyl carrier protein phosphodiesterase
MNWLAHLRLSDPDPMFRVGSLLPDLLPIADLRQLPAPFQEGITRHRQLDAFTDSHPAFKRSVARLNAPYRRYGGVLVDIFYDHLLTQRWTEYSDTPLPDFLTDAYAAFDECRDHIPSNAYALLRRMRSGNWLNSYGDIEGVRITLQRMSQRLRRPFDLGSATVELERLHESLHEDFAEFFPQATAKFGTQSKFEK